VQVTSSLGLLMDLIAPLSYSQNRDMEQQRLRVSNCGWCMVRWDRIAHPEYVLYLQLSTPSSHVPYRGFRRIDNGEVLAGFSSWTDAHANCQARWDVQPHHRCLYNPTYTQGPRQCSRRSRSRRNASPDHVHWASATCAQEFIRYMESALPAGDTQGVFSILLWILSQL